MCKLLEILKVFSQIAEDTPPHQTEYLYCSAGHSVQSGNEALAVLCFVHVCLSDVVGCLLKPDIIQFKYEQSNVRLRVNAIYL